MQEIEVKNRPKNAYNYAPTNSALKRPLNLLSALPLNVSLSGSYNDFETENCLIEHFTLQNSTQNNDIQDLNTYISKENIICLDWISLRVVPTGLKNIQPKQQKAHDFIKNDVIDYITDGFVFTIDRENYHVGMIWRKIYKVFTIYDNGTQELFAELETDNKHQMNNNCNLKLSNKFCYHPNRNELIEQCLKELNLSFIQFSQLDFAIDFQKFNNNIKSAQTFIKNILLGNYLKCGRAELMLPINAKTYDSRNHIAYADMFLFYQQFNRLNLTGCRWGKKSSGFQIRMYNKSLEMEKKVRKPYIISQWQKAGFDMDNEVWRIEFSLSLKNQAVLDTQTGEVNSILKNIEALTDEVINDTTKVLFERHFKFHKIHSYKRVKENGKTKVKKTLHTDRKRRLKYFYPIKLILSNNIKKTLAPQKNSGRTEKLIIKRLVNFYEKIKELNNFDNAGYTLTNLEHTIFNMIKEYNREDWYQKEFNHILNFDYLSSEYSIIKDFKVNYLELQKEDIFIN